METEPDDRRQLQPTLTLLLANRECPWKCVFCDLWQHTSTEPTPPGAVPEQIRAVLLDPKLNTTSGPTQIKLYNSGSFFDPQAIPVADHAAIATQVARFQRVIVECHPKLVGIRAVRFRDLLAQRQSIAANGALEVAIGLETAHEPTLERLNKRITLRDVARAAEFLHTHQIALRVFLLFHPPFMPPHQADRWLGESIRTAFELGATAVSLIPTRLGNGSLESLRQSAQFREPTLADLELVARRELPRRHGRLFFDLWDAERFASCPACAPRRIERLAAANRFQTAPTPAPTCIQCQV